MKTYWVCHVRGADFTRLRKLGFVVFAPMMDDYVFLETGKPNDKWLNKQEDLGIRFLKTKGHLDVVTEASLSGLWQSTVNKIEVGTEITVATGICEKLDGVVVEKDGDTIVCDLKGYRQIYHVTLSVRDVVLKGKELLKSDEDEEKSTAG